ncbi:hypothetical protein NDU88_003042, partial [Pleurodeles waltl]
DTQPRGASENCSCHGRRLDASPLRLKKRKNKRESLPSQPIRTFALHSWNLRQ